MPFPAHMGEWHWWLIKGGCRFVQTDMGNAGAKKVGLEKAYITVEESIAGMTKVVRFVWADVSSLPSPLH
jgi:hypothetical protein